MSTTPTTLPAAIAKIGEVQESLEVLRKKLMKVEWALQQKVLATPGFVVTEWAEDSKAMREIQAVVQQYSDGLITDDYFIKRVSDLVNVAKER